VNARIDQVTLSSRRLLQDTKNIVARMHAAKLTTFVDDTGSAVMPEHELLYRSDDTCSTEVPALHGACYLGPDEVAEMEHAIDTQMVCSLCSSVRFAGH
jgi:hypothetical protein